METHQDPNQPATDVLTSLIGTEMSTAKILVALSKAAYPKIAENVSADAFNHFVAADAVTANLQYEFAASQLNNDITDISENIQYTIGQLSQMRNPNAITISNSLSQEAKPLINDSEEFRKSRAALIEQVKSLGKKQDEFVVELERNLATLTPAQIDAAVAQIRQTQLDISKQVEKLKVMEESLQPKLASMSQKVRMQAAPLGATTQKVDTSTPKPEFE